jgi:hypothetical protein
MNQSLTLGKSPSLDVVMVLLSFPEVDPPVPDSPTEVEKIPGGEKIPSFSFPGSGTRTQLTRTAYSVRASSPLTRNCVSFPV